MNIVEQGIGDINIDLTAQTIDRVTIRDNDGGVEASGSGDKSVGPLAEETLHTYSGSGSFRYFLLQTAPTTSSEYITPKIYIDGTVLRPFKGFLTWNMWGLTAVTRPFAITKYAVNGLNIFIAYFEKGIVFDTSIAFKAYNSHDSNTVSVEGHWFYQKLS